MDCGSSYGDFRIRHDFTGAGGVAAHAGRNTPLPVVLKHRYNIVVGSSTKDATREMLFAVGHLVR
jgi:hypothetical protein